MPFNVVAMLAPGRLLRVQVLELGQERGQHARIGAGRIIRVNTGYGERSRRFIVAREAFHVALPVGAVELETTAGAAIEGLPVASGPAC